MKRMRIMMIIALSVCVLQTSLAQEGDVPPEDMQPEFFDNEIGEGEVIEPEYQEDIPEPPPEEPAPSRFRSRFNRDNNNNDNNATPPARTNNRPTTPVKDIKVTKVEKDGKKKLTFAEAQPEDITDENFPDIIESFNYPNANIMDVATAIGKLTKKNFVIEPGVNGKISIIAPTPVTVAQAWKIFLSALAINNYTIVPTGDGYLKIRKEVNAKNDSIETYSGAYFPTSDQLITRIIQLKYIEAESLKKSLEKFVSKKAGDVEAYENTNSIIVSGYGSSVERISKIIEELDKPGFEERLEVIPIRHAKSKDIAELIEKIIKEGEDDPKTSRFSRSRFNKNQGGKTENLKLVAPDERTNSIIVVGNKQGIDRIQKLVNRLDYPLDPADAGGVYVYYVKHGEALKIAETLSGIAEETEKAVKEDAKPGDKTFKAPKVQEPIFGGNVIIKADENTNSLIITASKQDYKVVSNLLAKIDIPKDQVFVEAVIMEMEAGQSNVWNMNYMKFFKSDNENSTSTTGEGVARAGFTGGNMGDLLNPVSGSGAILNLGDPSEMIQIAGPGGQLIEIPSLIALINFLTTKTNANILSTPNILAMDNEESEIEVGEEVPVGQTQNFSNTGQSSVSPQFRDATIHLKIKPFISPDSDIVRLNVEQKINKVSSKQIQAAALAATSQSLSKKSLKTNIVLESGQTAVLGGLMEDSDTVEETKIPLLGDIPVIGWLFKNKTVRSTKTNLIVFLTPKIIRNTAGHQSVLREKMSDRVDWIKKNAGGRDPYGEKFNNLIKDASATTRTFVPQSEEIELDLEEAIPLGEDPQAPSFEQELEATPFEDIEEL